MATARGSQCVLRLPHAEEVRPELLALIRSRVTPVSTVEFLPDPVAFAPISLGHGADFRQLMPRIIQRCRTENFALIVLDPIYKLYGGIDENAAGDVAELLN